MLAVFLVASLIFGSGALALLLLCGLILDIVFLNFIPQTGALHYFCCLVLMCAAPLSLVVLSALLKNFSLSENFQELPFGALTIALLGYLALDSGAWIAILLSMNEKVSAFAAPMAIISAAGVLFNTAFLVASGVAFLIIGSCLTFEFSAGWILSATQKRHALSLAALRLPAILFVMALFFDLVVRIYSTTFLS